jgi:hypothetical protein
MNILSAILRLLSGLALIIASYATYRRVKGQINASDPILIAGITIGASPREVLWGLGFVALIGFLLIILGAVTLLKKRS